MKRHALLLLATGLLGFADTAAAQPATPQPEVRHPLDPLGWNEHWRVLEILESSGRLTPKTRFTRIALSPPDKAKVLAWKPGAKTLPRQAEVRLKEGTNAVEALVDLDRGAVLDWKVRSDVQPAWLIEEFLGAPVQAVLNHPDFKAKLKARGIGTTRFLNCRAMPLGNHAEPKYAGKRVAIVRCDPVNGVRNLFVRRVEGLIAIVDVNTNEVLEISDDEVVPTTATKADYDRANLGKLRGFPTSIALSQPGGPSFTIDGHGVTWGNWSFHLRSDQRVGTQISRLTWNDGGKSRDVMYEGYLSEIFVPYMDPRRDWYTRTLLDAGEYSMGGLSGPLTPGIDCPETAAYMSGLITQDNGRPAEKDNVICVFERTTGDMSWRHADDGRPKRELVVRMVADLGNYDYVFDWVFESDGQFRVVTGATGIVAVQTSKAEDATALVNGKRDDAYGRFVDKGVIGVNHDHYFNFRLDLDIDGPVNSFLKDELKTVRLPDDHPRRSIWVSEETTLGRENDGKLSVGHGNPALWRVINPARRNHVGYPPSYQLMLGHTAHTLFSKDDVPRRRAGFIDNDLWITAYDPNERYAAGEYAVLSPPGEGLPKFAAANRPIANADIVLWPTFGMQHKVRAEDWPVMPVLWHSITVRPFDFFDRNPALDIDVKP
ncbi:MAG: hypothetical protein H3C60_02565 [Sphingomonadaceae bacterium]|nr:hypothetical protein [Sphingomonadaceae bacterium]